MGPVDSRLWQDLDQRLQLSEDKRRNQWASWGGDLSWPPYLYLEWEGSLVTLYGGHFSSLYPQVYVQSLLQTLGARKCIETF